MAFQAQAGQGLLKGSHCRVEAGTDPELEAPAHRLGPSHGVEVRVGQGSPQLRPGQDLPKRHALPAGQEFHVLQELLLLALAERELRQKRPGRGPVRRRPAGQSSRGAEAQAAPAAEFLEGRLQGAH